MTELENNAKTLLLWFNKNYVKTNPDKCHLFVPKHTEGIPIKIDKEIIKGKSTVELWGLNLDRKLNFNEHVLNLFKNAS